ncbi:type II toxin-antitoxin system RelE/ParE family toxin [Geminocystis sp.]|uniref:type II toxin-antitoxin system RelE/ParE family toxin n=1 Tax=Geminocystis sp. TaxID=2664100 RepID=UPI003594545C
MPNKNSLFEIKFAAQFKQDIKTLAKKYRQIKSDIKPIIEQLELGELIGVRIPETNDIFYKVRIKNSDIQKGKSGGYRLIYHVQGSTIIIMMTIYTKSEKEDISAKRIREILAEYENNNQ